MPDYLIPLILAALVALFTGKTFWLMSIFLSRKMFQAWDSGHEFSGKMHKDELLPAFGYAAFWPFPMLARFLSRALNELAFRRAQRLWDRTYGQGYEVEVEAPAYVPDPLLTVTDEIAKVPARDDLTDPSIPVVRDGDEIPTTAEADPTMVMPAVDAHSEAPTAPVADVPEVPVPQEPPTAPEPSEAVVFAPGVAPKVEPAGTSESPVVRPLRKARKRRPR